MAAKRWQPPGSSRIPTVSPLAARASENNAGQPPVPGDVEGPDARGPGRLDFHEPGARRLTDMHRESARSLVTVGHGVILAEIRHHTAPPSMLPLEVM